jgi:hypothetical protein
MKFVESKSTAKAKYFDVSVEKDDIAPPGDALLSFARNSSTFSFLTKATASAFSKQVCERYVDSAVPVEDHG